MRINTNLRGFLVSLSLANLMMMKVWLPIVPFRADQAFFLEHSQTVVYAGALVSTLLLALALWGVTHIAARWQHIERGVWPFMYGTAVALCLNGIRFNNGWSLELIYGAIGKWGTVFAALFVVVGAGYLLFRYRSVIVQKHSSIALIFSPFLLFTFGQSLLALTQVEPESAFSTRSRQHLQPVEAANAMPVVWIIFDELDYRMAFGHRPKSLVLPELDKLQQTCLYSSKAYSPSGTTLISLPELLTGKVFTSSTPLSANTLQLTAPGGKTTNLKTAQTIIADMQQRHKKIALFGWYLPYARLFPTVDVCKVYPLYFSPDGLAEAIAYQLGSLIESRFTFLTSDTRHILMTQSMQNDVIHFLKTFQGGFLFLHYPVPHPDYIYHRSTRTYAINKNQIEGYLDNLALTDRLLGEVHATMEKTGIWDKSLVIVSSDHHWRSNTYDGVTDSLHVPFLVKLPGQKKSLSSSDRFETVHTKEMILNVIDGKINTPEQLKTWMQNIPHPQESASIPLR